MSTLITTVDHAGPILVNGVETARNKPVDYRPEDRVEPIPKADFPHHLYPRWIGHKFTPDGTVIPFPGNTVICHLPSGSAIHQALRSLYDDIQEQDFASLLAFLPPSSWHMTVYEGVSDQIRTRGSWPGELGLDSSLQACHAHVASKLADFDHGLESSIQMTVVGFDPLTDGIALNVVPSHAGGERTLRKFRDQLATQLKMSHPGHPQYSFHVSLAYMLRVLTEEDRTKIAKYLEGWQARLPQQFELGLPEFCVFDGMCEFRRMFFLGGPNISV